MSMHKRNRDPPLQKETPTLQKHRFRNALAKANGIKYRDDYKINGARIYQFVGRKLFLSLNMRRDFAGNRFIISIEPSKEKMYQKQL